jgi:hypothetical protein
MITLFRHPDCERCARMARLHHRLDWLNRIKDTTAPPSGHDPPAVGQILVQPEHGGPLLEGVTAVREIFRQIPLYWLCLPLLYLPAIASRVDADARGCAGHCAVRATEAGFHARQSD